MAPGSGDVMGRAGLDRADPHRVAGVIGQHLDIAPEGLVLAREPRIGGPSRLTGMQCAGVDQGPIQTQEGLALLAHLLEDLAQARGPLCDDLQGLMQVAVGRGQADAAVPGQGLQVAFPV